MIVYLAGFKTIEKIYPGPVDDIYLLSSFWEHRSGQYGDYVRSKKHILDSGAYSAMANPGKAKSIDWDKYADDYADFIIQNYIRLYFELDLDSIIGIPAVNILRDRIENRTGIRAIPVWHKERGIEEWHRLTEEYDFVAIGGFVMKEIVPADFRFIIPMLNIAKRNNCRVHGLGFTTTKWLRKLKFHSVDSGTWLSGAKFGNICSIDKDGNILQKSEHRATVLNRKVKDRAALDIYNFNVWVRFQKWAETNL